MPISIFICYARKDEALLNELKTHLKPLEREGLIRSWYDRDISIGTKWEPQIMHHLNTAQIVLLLVSPDFMNSDYCYSIEMKRALERHKKGQARVIPIILRPVFWHGKPLGELQALPTDGKPVTGPDWHSLDTAFYNVTDGIYQVVKQLMPAPLPVEKLAMLHTLTGHTDSVTSVAISADGQQLFSASSDKTIKVWDLSTGREVRTLNGHTDSVTSVAISADGQRLFSGSYDKTIKEWDLSTGREMRTLLTGYTDGVWSLAISADGQQLFSGGGMFGGEIKEWDLSTGRIARTLTEQTSAVTSVAISADGQQLFSASHNKTIKEWDLSTGREVRILTGHTRGVSSVAISADGQTLVSGGDDSIIKVRDLSSGQEVRTLTGHTDAVTSVAISADGQTLVSGSYDQTIKVWGA